jgi:DNA-binding CsgD family transcriptional regulator
MEYDLIASHPGTKTPVVRLNYQERRILRALTEGTDCTTKTLSESLSLAPNTVRQYISMMLRTLGLPSRADLVVWATQNPEVLAACRQAPEG